MAHCQPTNGRGSHAVSIGRRQRFHPILAPQIGLYRIEFEAPGFKKAIRNRVELAAGAMLREDMVLEIGSVGESVQVSAQVSPLETETTGGQPASVGERAGNSTYHALVMKLDRRLTSGLSLLTSYVLSKQFSDSESGSIGGGGALDQYNKGLDKSLAGSDQTHVARIAFSYDLPFGKGKHFSSNRAVNTLVGDWTVSSFLSYESGTPDNVASGSSPIGTGSRVFITSYEGWRATPSGDKFDPNKDLWYDKSAFNQGISQATLDSMFGNATRNNPKLRTPWNLNENVASGPLLPLWRAPLF